MHTIDATAYRRPGSLRVLAWFLSLLFIVPMLIGGKEFIIDAFLDIPGEHRLTVSRVGDGLAYLLGVLLLLGMKKLWHKDLGAALRHEWGARWPSLPMAYLIVAPAIAVSLIVLRLAVLPPVTEGPTMQMLVTDFLVYLPAMIFAVLLVYGTLQHRWLDAPLWKNVLPVCLILFLHPLVLLLPYIAPPDDPTLLGNALRNDVYIAVAWTINAGLAATLYWKTRSLSPVLAYFVLFDILIQISGVIG